jgi:hypothetical protein
MLFSPFGSVPLAYSLHGLVRKYKSLLMSMLLYIYTGFLFFFAPIRKSRVVLLVNHIKHEQGEKNIFVFILFAILMLVPFSFLFLFLFLFFILFFLIFILKQDTIEKN